MPIVGANHTSYTVRDLERSIAFYRDMLGLELVHQREEITLDYWRAVVGFPDAVARDAFFRIPGSDHHLELIQYRHPPGTPQTLTPNNPGSSHICYYVDDLQAEYQRLQAAGCDFISAPVYLDQGPNAGGWALYMRDPDGIVIELFQRRPS